MAITRRTFASGTLAALASAALPSYALIPSHEHPPATGLLSETSLAAGWEISVDGSVTSTDTTLPHTPVALSWRRWEPSSWEKVWTYRRTLQVDKASLRRRLFLHVDRTLANASVSLNGTHVASHQGGFTPFEFGITDAVHEGANDLVIEVDGRWADVPRSGSARGFAAVDYYLPAGISGNVTLRTAAHTPLNHVWTRAHGVLSGQPSLDVFAEIDTREPIFGVVVAHLLRDDVQISQVRQDMTLAPGRTTVNLTLPSLQNIALWSPETPHLYSVVVTLESRGRPVDSRSVSVGFREARFELDGFYLNGRKTRLFGLNRHELFPYVGYAASPRAMRHDATYLRYTLNCNVVRCSHYPQSPAFLQACDEIGLMVWEEIPGWQYLGDAAWKKVAVQNVAEMIRRDRNHPSIIVWGTRVNESQNDPELYRRTRELARQLDPTRPTSGSMTASSRSDWKEHWQQDVFAFDDYHAAQDGSVGIDPALPTVPYMLAEAVGQFSYGSARNFLRRYRRAGNPEEQNMQAVLHAQAHDRAAQDPQNAGVIAWCGFDYASPMNAFEGVKCPGVVDTFRIPKLGASFYAAQVDPIKRVVLEPSFYWDADLHAATTQAAIFSNCDELQIFLDDEEVARVHADREVYPQLAYPPFFTDLPWKQAGRLILKIDGYVGGTLRISRSFDGSRAQDQLWLRADDASIQAGGIDTTRISFGVEDRFGNTRPTADGMIAVQHTGAGTLIGDKEFPLTECGAVGAVWLRSLPGQVGNAQVNISHVTLGARSLKIMVTHERQDLQQGTESCGEPRVRSGDNHRSNRDGGTTFDGSGSAKPQAS